MHLKSFLFVIFTLSWFLASSQNLVSEVTGDNDSHMSVGVYFSPEAADTYLKSTSTSEQYNQLLELRNGQESPKFGYTTGLSLAFNISNNFSLESGLQYSNKGTQIVLSNLTFNDLIDDRYGFIYDSPEFPETIIIKDRFQYLGIPLNLNYVMGKSKLKFIYSIGVTAEYLLRASTVTVRHYEDKRPEREARTEDNYNRINLSLKISLGIDYQLNERMNIRVQPTFRAGLLQIIDTPITGYVYNAGVLFGWNKRL